MNDRIKELRRCLHLTQEEFAARLGIKRNTIATYETGKSNPSDAAVILICKEFNVNEEWLRDGIGVMFKAEPTDTEQMTSDAKRVLEFLDSDPKAQELLKIYQGLPERGKDTMLLVMDAFIAGVKAGEDKTA